jgi:hypothetical protein
MFGVYTEEDIKFYDELLEHVSLKIHRVWPQALVVLKNVSLKAEPIDFNRLPAIQATIFRGGFLMEARFSLPLVHIMRESFSFFIEEVPRSLVTMLTQELMTSELFEDKSEEMSFYKLSLSKAANSIKEYPQPTFEEFSDVLAIIFDKSNDEIREDLFRLVR